MSPRLGGKNCCVADGKLEMVQSLNAISHSWLAGMENGDDNSRSAAVYSSVKCDSGCKSAKQDNTSWFQQGRSGERCHFGSAGVGGKSHSFMGPLDVKRCTEFMVNERDDCSHREQTLLFLQRCIIVLCWLQKLANGHFAGVLMALCICWSAPALRFRSLPALAAT